MADSSSSSSSSSPHLAMADSSSSSSPHALVISHPLHGHIAPLLHLSKSLSSPTTTIPCFRISFLLTEHALSLALLHSRHHLPSQLSFIGIHDGLPPDHPRRSVFLDAYEAVLGMQAGVERLIENLVSDHRPPTCIIADTFVIWAHHVAAKFNIPHVAFVTTNVNVMSVMAYTSTLLSMRLLPFNEAIDEPVEEPITCVPGVIPLLPRDFPESMRSPTSSHYRMQFVVKQFEHIHEAAAILVNSFYELEAKALDAAPFDVPIYTIGPTLLLNDESNASTIMDVSMWPEENDCLSWLDNQPSASVLYISFGSMVHLPSAETRNLALGLEASQQPFLWVIRQDAVNEPMSSVLPTGFLDRIKATGKVITWAPQCSVLSHPAVGGFITHCGWNSILENLSLGGVPMICWPCFAEQRTNCRLIVDEWGMGLELRKSEDGVVSEGEVVRAVKELMEGDGGKEVRKKAEFWRDVAKRATSEGGSSVKNLGTLVERLIRTRVKIGGESEECNHNQSH